MDRFANRIDAGKVLAKELLSYKDNPHTIVLGLPRGGVPVAYEIANALNLPLDIFVVRKLGVPGHDELAMGAIASGDVTVFNDDVLSNLPVSQKIIDQVIASESQELKRREEKYRGKQPFPNIKNKTVILVDDGIATGATIRAAIKALRKMHPAVLVAAVPVAEINTSREMEKMVDIFICPLKPHFFYAVAQWYDNFSQTTDEEVITLMKKAKNTAIPAGKGLCD